MWKLRQHKCRYSSYSQTPEPEKNCEPKYEPWMEKPQWNWGLTQSKGKGSRSSECFSLQTHIQSLFLFLYQCMISHEVLSLCWEVASQPKDGMTLEGDIVIKKKKKKSSPGCPFFMLHLHLGLATSGPPWGIGGPYHYTHFTGKKNGTGDII